MLLFFFLIVTHHPGSTHTSTLFPYSTLFLSARHSTSNTQVPGRDSKRRCGALSLRPRAPDPLRAPSCPEPTCSGTQPRSSAAPMCRWLWPYSDWRRSEEHTSELQSLMRISYAVFCLKKKKKEK